MRDIASVGGSTLLKSTASPSRIRLLSAGEHWHGVGHSTRYVVAGIPLSCHTLLCRRTETVGGTSLRQHDVMTVRRWSQFAVVTAASRLAMPMVGCYRSICLLPPLVHRCNGNTTTTLFCRRLFTAEEMLSFWSYRSTLLLIYIRQHTTRYSLL